MAGYQNTLPYNWIYYAEIGNGEWLGTFNFSITKWKVFWHEKIGIWNRLFSIINHFNHRVFGPSKIVSVLKVFPSIGVAGTITNLVLIKKFGITIYKLDERYVLHPDGTRLFVYSRERYGPISFLFNARKKHPAIVHSEGKGAKYLEMPILGTLWEGDYAVSATGEEINAKLHCSWAAGEENIRKIKAGAEVSPIKLSYPENINEVIETLEKYRDWFESKKDPRATFTHAYLEITKKFAEEIPRRNFKDHQWVYELDVLFAREYLKAIHEYELGSLKENGWKFVFDIILSKKTSVLEELLLSMAAHIIQDLPIALDQSGWKNEPTDERISDFHLLNEILGDGIDEIQTQVSSRYNPFLNRLDQFGRKDDEILTNYGIRLSRGMAWYNALRLTANPEEIEKSLPKSVKVIVNQIISPPFSLAFVLRIFRVISKLSRKWPAPGAEI